MGEVRFGEESMAEAWTNTMRGLDLPKLYRDWTAIQIRYPTIAIAYRATPDTVQPEVTAVNAADLALHMAARWNWGTEDGRRRAAGVVRRDRTGVRLRGTTSRSARTRWTPDTGRLERFSETRPAPRVA